MVVSADSVERNENFKGFNHLTYFGHRVQDDTNHASKFKSLLWPVNVIAWM